MAVEKEGGTLLPLLRVSHHCIQMTPRDRVDRLRRVEIDVERASPTGCTLGNVNPGDKVGHGSGRML